MTLNHVPNMWCQERVVVKEEHKTSVQVVRNDEGLVTLGPRAVGRPKDTVDGFLEGLPGNTSWQ